MWGYQEEGPSYAPGVSAAYDRYRGVAAQRDARNRMPDKRRMRPLLQGLSGMEVPHNGGKHTPQKPKKVWRGAMPASLSS